MTFAFFSGDAYIPLLLQTWRGTPATLTGPRVHRDDDRVDGGDLAPGPADRPVGPTPVRRPRLRLRRGRRADHDPGGAPRRAARDHDPDLGPARPWHGLHVLGGDAGRAPRGGARRDRAPPRRRCSCPTSWARRWAPGSPARSRPTARGRAATRSAGRWPRCSGCRSSRRRFGAIASRADPAAQARAEHADRCGRLATRPRPLAPTPPRRRRSRHHRRSPNPMSAETLRAKIREIPDFPKPGILFYDITTVLKEPGGLQGGHRPHARALPGRADRPRGRHGVAGLHLLGADGVPARHRASSRCASWASCRPRR